MLAAHETARAGTTNQLTNSIQLCFSAPARSNKSVPARPVID
jgi:hypothetical protein